MYKFNYNIETPAAIVNGSTRWRHSRSIQWMDGTVMTRPNQEFIEEKAHNFPQRDMWDFSEKVMTALGRSL